MNGFNGSSTVIDKAGCMQQMLSNRWLKFRMHNYWGVIQMIMWKTILWRLYKKKKILSSLFCVTIFWYKLQKRKKNKSEEMKKKIDAYIKKIYKCDGSNKIIAIKSLTSISMLQKSKKMNPAVLRRLKSRWWI